MKLLALDTTTERVVIALKNDDNTDFFVSEKGGKKHNSALLGYIDAVLKKNGLELKDLDCMGVAVGPGSFTGIRVGVATVNAFSLALGIKKVEITTLELPERESDSVVMLDCGHGNFYCGIFQNNTVDYRVLTEEEAKKTNLPLIYMNGTYEKELLKRSEEKLLNGSFVNQAKPFYLRKSSAERETGIEC